MTKWVGKFGSVISKMWNISPPVIGHVTRHMRSDHHGLYGSTSCCISHGPCQWERAIFDLPPPHSSETPGPILMKLEIYNYFPDTTPHAKFQGLTSTWVVWANSHFDVWKFLSFFSFFDTPTVRIFGHIPTLNTSLYVVSAKVVFFWGLERLNLKFDPLYAQKT